jgi:hypothetical protein
MADSGPQPPFCPVSTPNGPEGTRRHAVIRQLIWRPLARACAAGAGRRCSPELHGQAEGGRLGPTRWVSAKHDVRSGGHGFSGFEV